ncbi:ABC transporter substrate-binding protein [Chloroflexota bacterium]
MKVLHIGILITAIVLLSSLIGCNSSDNEDNGDTVSVPTPSVTPTVIPTGESEPVTITIGNLTDITGPASNPLSVIATALEDLARYYNENNLIPGVVIQIVEYDGAYDPAKDIPGYEWLKGQGADFIFSSVGSVPITLKPIVDKDKVVVFTMTPDRHALAPPGYVFCLANTLGDYQSYTLLNWIAENDPGFPVGRPAKVGGAFWAEAYSQTFLDGMEKYSEVHPDQYEYVGGYTTNFSFMWGPEVEALKDCDYVMPPGPMQHFTKEYRDAGYQARLIGTDFQISILKMTDDMDLWDESDKMLLLRTGFWWNEEGEMVNLAKQLLYDYHPDEAASLIAEGPGYQALRGIYVMFEIVKETVETVGAQNFTSEELYEVAQSFSLTVDGIENHSFTKTKRTSVNNIGMYELRGAEKDIVRIDPEWIPILYEP